MPLNLATRVTISRLLLAPLFATAAAYHSYRLALVLFVVAGLTDAVDGFIARRFEQRTRLGAVLDALADKFLVMSGVVVLTVVPAEVRVPVWLTILVIARDALIAIVVLALFATTGRSDFPPSVLGKLTTGALLAYLSYVLAANAFAVLDGGALMPLSILSGLLTVASGLDYVLQVAGEAASAGEGGGPPGGGTAADADRKPSSKPE